MRRLSTCAARLLPMLTCVALLPVPQAGAADKPSYRDLSREYFTVGSGEALADAVGFSEPVKNVIRLDYKVLKMTRRADGTDSFQPVDPKQVKFKLGDRIRITITPYDDYYVYIFNVGTSGKGTFLQPDETLGETQPPLVKKGEDIVFWENSWLTFRPPAGKEQLMVVATQELVEDLAMLRRVLTTEPSEDEPEAVKKVRMNVKAAARADLISEEEKQRQRRMHRMAMARSMPNKEEMQKLRRDVQKDKLTAATIEETSDGGKHGTSAIYVSTKKNRRDKLLVHIPLVSIQGNASK